MGNNRIGKDSIITNRVSAVNSSRFRMAAGRLPTTVVTSGLSLDGKEAVRQALTEAGVKRCHGQFLICP